MGTEQSRTTLGVQKVFEERKYMMSFKQFLAEQNIIEQIQLFEHHVYKAIPGSKNSFRIDPGNTNTKTLKHVAVYAKLNGRGTELYAVNIDGSGHDGSSGMHIPSNHADYFRGIGYQINPDNILECFDLVQLSKDNYMLLVVEKSELIEG